MEVIKSLMLAGMFLLTLTAGKCFVVSNFDTSDDDDDDDRNRGGLTIGITNGSNISKQAFQSLTQTLTVAEVASQSMQYTSNAMVAVPFHYSCENSFGELDSTTYDLDYSNTITSGDEIFLQYKNCQINNEIINGDLKIFILQAKGIENCNYNSGIDWQLKFRADISTLQCGLGEDAFEVDGKMVIALKYSAKKALLQAIISNNNVIISSDSDIHLSGSKITQLLSLAATPSNYTLSVDSYELFSEEQNGFVDIEAKNLFGIERLSNNKCFVSLQSPEKGFINIKGKDSNADIRFLPGEQINIDIDSDGDFIPEETIYSNMNEMK